MKQCVETLNSGSAYRLCSLRLCSVKSLFHSKVMKLVIIVCSFAKNMNIKAYLEFSAGLIIQIFGPASWIISNTYRWTRIHMGSYFKPISDPFKNMGDVFVPKPLVHGSGPD